MKSFTCSSHSQEVIIELERNHLAIFTGTTTPFKNFCKKLKPQINNSILEGHTNHPTEGYLYFLYDSRRLLHEEAKVVILKNYN